MKISFGKIGQGTVRVSRDICRNVLRLLLLWVSSIELLDIIVCSAFTLLTSGAYMLWGPGWACIMLGSLLLSLIFIGIPIKQKT